MASTELFSSSRSWLMMIAEFGYFRQPRLQPHRAFEVEVVGGFVQQQQVGFGEQRRRQGDAHAPAAGELRHRARQVGGGETQAGQDFAGAGGGAVGVDLGQPGVDVGDALGFGGLQFGVQGVALLVGGQDGVEQADRGGGVLLVHAGDAGELGAG